MSSAPVGSSTKQSRPRAALLRVRAITLLQAVLARAALTRAALAIVLLVPLALAGCATGGTSPLGAIFRDALQRDDIAARAAEIPFASLALEAEDRSGLVVLGALVEPESYWPTGNRGLVTLRHEGLHATAGFAADLLDTHYQLLDTGSENTAQPPWRMATPPPFRVTRTWQRSDELTQRMSATGSLSCAAAEAYALPLATLTLQPCTLTLRWEDGSRTGGTLWREPSSLRLWAVEEQAWPGGPTLTWEVARQWW